MSKRLLFAISCTLLFSFSSQAFLARIKQAIQNSRLMNKCPAGDVDTQVACAFKHYMKKKCSKLDKRRHEAHLSVCLNHLDSAAMAFKKSSPSRYKDLQANHSLVNFCPALAETAAKHMDAFTKYENSQLGMIHTKYSLSKINKAQLQRVLKSCLKELGIQSLTPQEQQQIMPYIYRIFKHKKRRFMTDTVDAQSSKIIYDPHTRKPLFDHPKVAAGKFVKAL